MATFVHSCSAVSSNRYDNTGGGAIEVISPAGSPAQPQQEKPDEGQQQTGMRTSFMKQEKMCNIHQLLFFLRFLYYYKMYF